MRRVSWPERWPATVPAVARARLRSRWDDFRVDEDLGFEPDGSGDHAWLQVRKQGQNTGWVAEQLARHAGLPRRAVGYSGLKDRHAVTSQWFSIDLSGRPEPDWSALEDANLAVLRAVRHRRKLRVGSHRANRFSLRLTGVQASPDPVEARLEQIRRRGVPNYFGSQRFGRGGANLQAGAALLAGQGRRPDRSRRGIYLSALRAALFNDVLGERVRRGSWDRLLPGEAVMLSGSRSYFIADTVDGELRRRLEGQDVHPSGPMVGRGELPTRGEASALERAVLDRHAPWCRGLAAEGLEQERRALRLVVEALLWRWEARDVLVLEFTLPRGAFATAVLQEFVEVAEHAEHGDSAAGGIADSLEP